MRRLVVSALAIALVASACVVARDEPRVFTAHFSRAVQLFPGVKVKVLGVDVGRVLKVENVSGAVEVTFHVDRSDVKIPADVEAAIVPVSLLGERYVQLLPAYEGGAELEPGTTIPLERTGVPAEGDELLQAMQDYLGELDDETVGQFVSNAARILEGRGERLNDLIGSATEVLAALAAERDELADMIVQFNTITQTLSTRQESLSRLFSTYNVVATTLVEARGALEGTITGLNDAAAELAGLLVENRPNLGADIKTLTKTTRTLDRNVNTLARTGKWARRLFKASSRSVDYERDWLRLGNQGAPLMELIMWRLQDRLVGLCLRLEIPGCANQRYWQERLPELFCVGILPCPDRAPAPERTFEEAVGALPGEVETVLQKAAGKNCKNAKNPEKCRKRKKEIKEAEATGALDELINGLVNSLGALGGGGA